jgi:hypothetical protein
VAVHVQQRVAVRVHHVVAAAGLEVDCRWGARGACTHGRSVTPIASGGIWLTAHRGACDRVAVRGCTRRRAPKNLTPPASCMVAICACSSRDFGPGIADVTTRGASGSPPGNGSGGGGGAVNVVTPACGAELPAKPRASSGSGAAPRGKNVNAHSQRVRTFLCARMRRRRTGSARAKARQRACARRHGGATHASTEGGARCRRATSFVVPFIAARVPRPPSFAPSQLPLQLRVCGDGVRGGLEVRRRGETRACRARHRRRDVLRVRFRPVASAAAHTRAQLEPPCPHIPYTSDTLRRCGVCGLRVRRRGDQGCVQTLQRRGGMQSAGQQLGGGEACTTPRRSLVVR